MHLRCPAGTYFPAFTNATGHPNLTRTYPGMQEGEDSASEEEGGDQEQDDDFFTIRGANKGKGGGVGGGGDGGSDSEDDDDDGDKAVGGGDRSKFSPDLEALEDWEETGEDCAIEALRNK